MAALSGSSSECCTLKKALNRLISNTSSSPRTRTRSEPLYVISLERYGRDADFALRFPDSVSMSESLFDATITDGDCKIRVSLDPAVNRLISVNMLHCGSVIRHVELSRGEDSASFHVCSLEVDRVSGGDAALRALSSVSVRAIPWMGAEPSAGPLRARRSSYLPLWNNHDFCGEMWRDTAPSEPDAEDSEEEIDDIGSTVSLAEVRRHFLSGSRRYRGALCVRILHKSRLIYFGKADQKCECPYKAELQVADGSSSACVVLWNTVCLEWYRILHPGQVVRLCRYRVKDSYSSRTGQDSEPHIEISLNSRNPAAQITIIPKNQISPDWVLPDLPHSFICGQELPSCPQGHIGDVIGVVIFVGRPERVRRKDGQRSEIEEYRWLQLADRTSDKPIMIKLFSTSQPDIQSRIYPMALLVCTRLKLIRSAVDRATTFEYLTNTSLTQVYCTGTGSHPVMPYRGIRPIRQFLHWLKQVDESSLLERAVIGGYFGYPPLPVSLPNFMENRRGEAGLISGGEMKLECEKLIYREKRQFAIQCVITAACYHHREDSGRTQYSDLPSAPLSPRVRRQREGSEPHRTPVKRKLFSSTSPRKRLAPPLQPLATEDDAERDFSLFDGAMEFLVGEQEDDSNDEDEDEDFSTPPSSPMTSRLGLTRVANETLPRVFCYERRHVQAVAVGLQVNNFHKLLPQRELESFSPASCYTGYFTLTMRALSDGVMLDVVFLPAAPGNLHWMPLPLSHNNSWESILSHGGFSPHAPPPSPADLIATANQLTNQRLLCVLDACALGGEKMELVLNRAFPLR
ncbi:RPA-related protein RADX [Cyprinus carpio]|uniref:Si:ch73-71d17.2 n=2 Tax=Cyprinus carpio TaxID=7962 RepID=A0A8C1CUG6_CYPCA|nr:RPA-related protein RADX [Cyprinus carpio]